LRLFDSASEIQVVRSCCDSPLRIKLLSKINSDHFGFDRAKEIFLRIINLVNLNKPIPSTDVLRNDESLSQESRALIADPTYAVLHKEDDITASYEILEKYRKARVILSAISLAADKMKDDSPDIDSVVSSMENMLQKCHNASNKEEMVHYCSLNFENLAKEIESDLRNTHLDLIPSSFAAFDRDSGGFPRGSVIAMASVPGGGKSALSTQMAANQYLMGFNVLYVSYEMSEVEIRYRLLSSQSKIDHKAIKLKQLDNKQIEHINKSFSDFILPNSSNRLTIWCPSREMTIPEIGMEVKPYNYDIIYIDYISLLKADPRMAMWEVLGNHARSAKLVASSLNACMVLLAQYDQNEAKIKYSQAITANAHCVWAWEHGEKEKTSGIIEVKQLKNRSGTQEPFYLQRDFKIMSFKDYSGPPPEEFSKEEQGLPSMPELN
jgi:replicative DNA helicase